MTETISDLSPDTMQLELDCVGGHDLQRRRYRTGDGAVAVAVGCPDCATSFGCHVIREGDDE